jgi:pyruvate/2-oxoglutarate dehydrogenase complex dihydrolipoamide dehydrogenase (E3) component
MSALLRPERVDEEWQRLVFPSDYRNPTPAGRYNLVVIGAGPAGLVTSIVAAGLGAKVALIEARAMGGDCLNFGCVPSKSLLAAAAGGASFADAMQRARTVRTKIAHHDAVERYSAAGVDVFLGQATFVTAHGIRVGDAMLRTRKTVIATGAHPFVPPIPGLADVAPLTNETIFDLTERPARLAVLGGGAVGCELAQAFAQLGIQVDLIEMQPRLLNGEEVRAAELLAGALRRDGVRLHLGAQVTGAGRSGHGKTLSLNNGETIEADEVLVAVGRSRNVTGLGLEGVGVKFDARQGIEVDARLQTSHPDIYAAGDVCARHQFTHVADAHARAVVRNTLFAGRARVDALAIPLCTYTKPEIARVGPSATELTRDGKAFDRYEVKFADLDRGRTDGSGEDYAEVLTEKGSDRIIGATIVGKDAGEQLSPILVMMASGVGLARLGSLVLPYPTRSEYLRRLADAQGRTRFTPRVARLFKAWLQFRR